MLEALSARLAAYIKHIVPEHPASQAVLQFAIAVILNTVSIVVLTLTVALFTGKFSEALMILFSFAAMRQVSGGIHLKSGLACVLFTTGLFTGLTYVEVDLMSVQIMNGLSFLLVILLAPAGIEGQTRIAKPHWPKLKWIAATLVITNCFLTSPVIAASFLAQSLSLLMVGKGGRNGAQASGSQNNL